MKTNTKKAIGIGSMLFVLALGMAACGDSTTGGETTTGRLVSVSDTQIVVDTNSSNGGGASGGAVGEKKMMRERPDNASGGAIGDGNNDGKGPGNFDGKKPDDIGDRDKDDNSSASGSGIREKGGQRPNGKPDGVSGGAVREGAMGGKQFTITDKTKIYKISNGETVEISMDEVELGSNLTVVATGDEATSITISEDSNDGHKGKK